MKRILRWFLWTPRRAALGAGTLVGALILSLLGAAYTHQWVTYLQTKAAYETEQADAGEGAGPNTATGIVPNPLNTPEDAVPAPAPPRLLDLDGTASSALPAPAEPGAASPRATIADSDADVADPDAESDVLAAGDAFARVFFTATSYPDAAAWAAELQPLSTPALHPYLAAVALDQVPTGTATGDALELGPYSATLAYPLTDGTRLELLLVLDAVQGWRVSDYRPLP